ncbi:MAG: C-terminal binding protein [Planctomyces sp.]|nr:C-terminal binding protein [Planctomyces sp.]
MPKVAVTDYSFEALDVETAILQPLGCELVAIKEKKTAPELIPLVSDADCVITQFAPVNAEVISAMQKAKVIVRYGIGVDNVNLAAARERGIPVCNVPDYCIDEVADQTLAFVLSATRQLQPNSLTVRSGAWKLAVPLTGMKTLKDLTVGLVGCGRIGREVVRRLLAFKCRVLIYDPMLKGEVIRELGASPVSLEELLTTSDVISLHCPSTDSTRKMINGDTISKMKPGVIIINVARGDLIETEALIGALRSGHVSSAGLDVFDPEPIPKDSPLLTMDNVVVAAHIASASVLAVRKLRETVAGIVGMAIRGEKLPNIVNGVDA